MLINRLLHLKSAARAVGSVIDYWLRIIVEILRFVEFLGIKTYLWLAQNIAEWKCGALGDMNLKSFRMNFVEIVSQ